jgi:hypothetical protein
MPEEQKMEGEEDYQDSYEEGNGNIGSNSNEGSEFNSGRWSDEEHNLFLEALKLYGRNWNLVH